MELPKSLKIFLSELNGESAPSLHNFSSLIHETAVKENSKFFLLTVTDQSRWNKELSLILMWRSFLALLPAQVIEKPDEPCKELVKKRLNYLLGDAPSDEDLDLVMLTVKRLQLYASGGRSLIGNNSLDIDKISHFNILKRQNFRCNNCGYKFKESDLEFEGNYKTELGTTDDSESSSQISCFDRSPERLFRNAVLDHIYPIYLG